MSEERKAERDVMLEWLAKGREVLEMYYPEAAYGLMVIHIGPDLPDVQLPVTRPGAPNPAASSPSRASA